MAAGLGGTRERRPWPMNEAFPKKYFDQVGLVSLLNQRRRGFKGGLNRRIRNRTSVVWEDGAPFQSASPIRSGAEVTSQGTAENCKDQRIVKKVSNCYTAFAVL